MPKKGSQFDASRRGATFIRQWRKHAGMTQGEAIERVRQISGVDLSVGHLSRMERGGVPYNQDALEALAEAYSVTVAQLLEVNPDPDDGAAPAAPPAPLLTLWATLEPNEQSRLMQVAMAMFGGKP